MTKEKSVEHLDDAVVVKLECTKCGKLHEAFAWTDTGDFAHGLYMDGWRGTDNHIYCPVCARTFKLK